jgi:hypothetical protein
MVLACATICIGASTAQAFAATPQNPVVRTIHLDITKQQQIESIVALPSGGEDASFVFAGEVAHIAPNGSVTILATLPPRSGGGPGYPAGLALARSGDLYVVYTAGSADLNGVWRISPRGSIARVTPMPASAVLNGLAIDPSQRWLYFTDSTAGIVYRAPVAGGPARVWAQTPQLAPAASLGANGVQVHGGAIWVTSTDQGLLLRFPVKPSGAAGAATVVATGVTGIDDFTFDAGKVIAAMNAPNEVIAIDPNGSYRVLLTIADGLENPTSIARCAGLLFIASGAYHTMTDPNVKIVRAGELLDQR